MPPGVSALLKGFWAGECDGWLVAFSHIESRRNPLSGATFSGWEVLVKCLRRSNNWPLGGPAVLSSIYYLHSLVRLLPEPLIELIVLLASSCVFHLTTLWKSSCTVLFSVLDVMLSTEDLAFPNNSTATEGIFCLVMKWSSVAIERISWIIGSIVILALVLRSDRAGMSIRLWSTSVPGLHMSVRSHALLVCDHPLRKRQLREQQERF